MGTTGLTVTGIATDVAGTIALGMYANGRTLSQPGPLAHQPSYSDEIVAGKLTVKVTGPSLRVVQEVPAQEIILLSLEVIVGVGVMITTVKKHGQLYPLAHAPDAPK